MNKIRPFDGKQVAPHFSDEYKLNVCVVWYNSGKPNVTYLHQRIPEDSFGRKPTRATLDTWIKENFLDWAKDWDDRVRETLSDSMVAEKIKMMERHIEIGTEMQEMALEYLRTSEESLNSNSAVRLLIEGLRIERQSRGIPEALAKMQEMSDESLMKKIEDLVADAPIQLEAGAEPLYDEET